MKKFNGLFISGLIAVCFSLGLIAQSSQQNFDQVELMKQFVGTWKTELGVDTIMLWEVIPSGKGYLNNAYWQAKGKTYSTVNGIIGFTWKGKLPDQRVNISYLWPNGYISFDEGNFVSEKKLPL